MQLDYIAIKTVLLSGHAKPCIGLLATKPEIIAQGGN